MNKYLRSGVGLALVIVCILLAGYFAFRNTDDPNALSDKITMVCVESGEIFKMDRDDVAVIPMKNPETGRRTLLPCQGEPGGYRISNHYAQALQQGELKERNQHVDLETLEVTNVQ